MVLTSFPGLAASARPAGLTSQARRILGILGFGPETELSLVLTDDRHIQVLNSAWRKVDNPTDVLSFSLREGEGGPIHHQALGDVVISVETSRRQAVARGWSLEDELVFLLIHGILHLAGYDHGVESEAQQMEEKTRKIWGALRRPAPLPSGFLS